MRPSSPRPMASSVRLLLAGVTGDPQRHIRLRMAGPRGAGTASSADVVLCARMELVRGGREAGGSGRDGRAEAGVTRPRAQGCGSLGRWEGAGRAPPWSLRKGAALPTPGSGPLRTAGLGSCEVRSSCWWRHVGAAAAAEGRRRGRRGHVSSARPRTPALARRDFPSQFEELKI